MDTYSLVIRTPEALELVRSTLKQAMASLDDTVSR
jgi:hypothetical protein